MRTVHWINFALYYAGWFACVLGPAWGYPWTGTAIALALIACHLAPVHRRRDEMALMGAAALFGTAVDTVQIAAGLLRFPTGVTLRITNPYGPRQQIHHNKYAMVGWFIRQALEGQTIRIFGDGAQRRDYIYIDDITEAFLRCAVARGAAGEVINIGSGEGTRFRDTVQTVVDVVGRGRVENVEWPKDYEKVETGDFVADLTKLERLTGWRSRVDLRTGIERTTEYYRRAWSQYVR